MYSIKIIALKKLVVFRNGIFLTGSGPDQNK